MRQIAMKALEAGAYNLSAQRATVFNQYEQCVLRIKGVDPVAGESIINLRKRLLNSKAVIKIETTFDGSVLITPVNYEKATYIAGILQPLVGIGTLQTCIEHMSVKQFEQFMYLTGSKSLVTYLEADKFGAEGPAVPEKYKTPKLVPTTPKVIQEEEKVEKLIKAANVENPNALVCLSGSDGLVYRVTKAKAAVMVTLKNVTFEYVAKSVWKKARLEGKDKYYYPLPLLKEKAVAKFERKSRKEKDTIQLSEKRNCAKAKHFNTHDITKANKISRTKSYSISKQKPPVKKAQICKNSIILAELKEEVMPKPEVKSFIQIKNTTTCKQRAEKRYRLKKKGGAVPMGKTFQKLDDRSKRQVA
jgi:hypothetical protein